MQQFEFVCNFLKRLHEAGIHTCMETCGQAPTERYMEIAPYVDLFLFDARRQTRKAQAVYRRRQ